MPRTMPRYKGDKEPVPAYSEAELEELRKLAGETSEIWKADLAASGGNRGTCVMGAGLAVYVRFPRARYARQKVLVRPPGQADCRWCSAGAMRYLEEHDVQGLHFEYGRMD